MKNTNTASATTGIGKPASLDDINKAVELIKSLPTLDQWLIVNPQGQMYKGTIEQMLPIMFKAHPLFTNPITLDFGILNKPLTT
jgi:hypothetical protein